MQSKAQTVEQYLAELPPDRRAAISAVRDAIVRNLDKDYAETMSYGMIGYHVPKSVYPPGYHCNPEHGLPFAGLASQKNYMSVYLMSAYEGGPEAEWLHGAFERAGKKLDMGKCCIRFKRLDDLAVDAIGEAVRRMPTRAYIEWYEKSRAQAAVDAEERRAARSKGGGGAKPAAKKGSGGPKASKKVGTKAVTKRGGPKASKKTANKAGKKTAKKGARRSR
jgi:hypothetical protein